jgi:A/G-specific adenine glycosylase
MREASAPGRMAARQWSECRAALLRWYDRTARDLPWRRTRVAYRVWLSEVMLQQTRVATVLPFYDRFLRAFPDVASLAAAPLDRVLKLWEGLGYYRRARDLHRAARVCAAKGETPMSAAAWRELPGVGAYTAAAVASIVHREPIAAIDGNVRRVLARIGDVPQRLDRAPGRARIEALARRLLDPARPGASNQALMELGAAACLPRNPACGACPVARWCVAHGRGTQARRPVPAPRPAPRVVRAAAGEIRRNGRLLLVRRPLDGMLGGLWELPGALLEDNQAPNPALTRYLRTAHAVSIRVGERIGHFDHILTHRRLRVSVYRCELLGVPCRRSAKLCWANAADLATLPMSRLTRKALALAGARRLWRAT